MSRDGETGGPEEKPAAGSAEVPAANLEIKLAELDSRIGRLEELLARWPGMAAATTTEVVAGAAKLDLPASPPPPVPVAPPAPRFEHVLPPRQASLEDRLGSQVFNRVGIVAVLIGTTWFLKWAMDNHWVGALGRVVIGLIAGAGIVVFSERFRRQGYKAFAWSLKAVGAGILYLSLWAAFQVYHLLPAGAAFAAMIAVTAWNAYLAWSQDAEILAVYAMVGGFATPLLLSTGQEHNIFLLSYLLSLDLAIVLLVRLKGWSRMLPGALAATAAYYFAAYGWGRLSQQPGVAATFILLFLAAFAIPSLALPWAAGDEEDRAAPSVIVDVLLPIATAAFTGLALYTVLRDQWQKAWEPWVAVALGALYLGLTRLQRTRVATAIHLMLGIVYLTLAIPLKASGRWLALGWLAEGVALLWISAHLESSAGDTPDHTPASIHRTLRVLASLALALGFVDLVLLPFWHAQPRTAFLNARFASALAGLVGLAIAVWIALRAKQDDVTATPSWPAIALTGTVAFNLLALPAGIQEIHTFWSGAWSYGSGGADAGLREALSISAFLMAYGALLLAAGFWRRNAPIRWQALLLLLVSIVKTFLYDMRTLSQGYRVASFLALGALLMTVSFAYQKDWLGLKRAGVPAEETGPLHEETSR
jgi:uncharacterized membrane protein